MFGVFHCEATFTIPSRRLFVIAGRILEGHVAPGMKVGIPTTSGALRLCLINSIEHITKDSGPGAVGLAVECVDEDELGTLQAAAIHDVDCVVTAEDPRSTTIGQL